MFRGAKLLVCFFVLSSFFSFAAEPFAYVAETSAPARGIIISYPHERFDLQFDEAASQLDDWKKQYGLITGKAWFEAKSELRRLEQGKSLKQKFLKHSTKFLTVCGSCLGFENTKKLFVTPVKAFLRTKFCGEEGCDSFSEDFAVTSVAVTVGCAAGYLYYCSQQNLMNSDRNRPYRNFYTLRVIDQNTVKVESEGSYWLCFKV